MHLKFSPVVQHNEWTVLFSLIVNIWNNKSIKLKNCVILHGAHLHLHIQRKSNTWMTYLWETPSCLWISLWSKELKRCPKGYGQLHSSQYLFNSLPWLLFLQWLKKHENQAWIIWDIQPHPILLCFFCGFTHGETSACCVMTLFHEPNTSSWICDNSRKGYPRHPGICCVPHYCSLSLHS